MNSTILWLLAAFLLFSLCTCRDHKQNPRGTVNFEDKNLNFSWKINSTKKEKTIRFKVNAVIYESGWFLIGFQPQPKGETPKNITETRGDAFVVWKKKTVTSGGKNVWRVTDCNTFDKGNLQRDQKQNYHLPRKLLKTMYDSKKNMLTAIVWRKLKTEDDKEDVIIKPGLTMFVFGSYGNDNSNKKWQNELKKIRGGIQDVFRTSNIDFFEGNLKTKKGGRDFVKYAENLAEQHWIGLVVGLSAFLTILITCTVYCIAKKGSGRLKNKHVSMSFHKDRSEYDDEAKVAFLQSEET